MTQLPPPGWYADATDNRYQRWWDGQIWTDTIRLAAATPPVGVEPGRPKNGVAIVSLVFGIIGAVIAVVVIGTRTGITPLIIIGIFAFGATAVATGIPALIKSGRLTQNTGRAFAITGLAVGGVAIILMFIGVVAQVNQYSSVNSLYDRADVENHIANSYDDPSQVQDVSCPQAPQFHAGDTFKCVTSWTDGTSTTVVVEVQDDEGSIYWNDEG